MIEPETLTTETESRREIHPGAAEPQHPAVPQQKRMWILWVLFFFQYAAIGAYFTFLNVYYREVGLSGTQIGLMSMIGSCVGIVGTFFWGYLSDRTGKPGLLIAIGSLGGLLIAQLIPMVARMGLQNPLGVYILIGCAGNLMSASVNTLLDSTTLAMLGERREYYGKYRLGGSIGYIIATVAAGNLFERVGLSTIFPVYGVLMLCFTAIALFLPQRAVRLHGTGQQEIGRMIRQPAWLIFVVAAFLMWIATNASIMFMGVILKSMGAGDQLIAYAVVIGAIIELPFMAFSNRLINRFGAARLMWFAMFLQIIRFFLLSQMHAPVWAIAINTLNGPGFVLLWNGSVNYVAQMAPPGLAATAQGLFNSTTSLASILSALISGVLFDRIGPSGLFLTLTGCCIAAFVLFGLGTILKKQPVVEANV